VGNLPGAPREPALSAAGPAAGVRSHLPMNMFDHFFRFDIVPLEPRPLARGGQRNGRGTDIDLQGYLPPARAACSCLMMLSTLKLPAP